MSEWKFAQSNPAQQLCQIHYFGYTRQQEGGAVDFVIAVREYVTPHDPAMKFHATADKSTNQRTMVFQPCGWGNTLLAALGECIRAIERFPYQEPLA